MCCAEAGVAVFGPDAQGAQLEAARRTAKEFMQANGIPRLAMAASPSRSRRLVRARAGHSVVVKADGLAAGKGVVVADTIEVAEEAVRSCFDGAFGSAGSKVLWRNA